MSRTMHSMNNQQSPNQEAFGDPLSFGIKNFFEERYKTPESPPFWDFLSRCFPAFWEKTVEWDAQIHAIYRRKADGQISRFMYLPFYSFALDFRFFLIITGLLTLLLYISTLKIFRNRFYEEHKQSQIRKKATSFTVLFFFLFTIKLFFAAVTFLYDPVFYFTFSDIWVTYSAAHIYCMLADVLLAICMFLILRSANFEIGSNVDVFIDSYTKMYHKYQMPQVPYFRYLFFVEAFLGPAMPYIYWFNNLIRLMLGNSSFTILKLLFYIHHNVSISTHFAFTYLFYGNWLLFFSHTMVYYPIFNRVFEYFMGSALSLLFAPGSGLYSFFYFISFSFLMSSLRTSIIKVLEKIYVINTKILIRILPIKTNKAEKGSSSARHTTGKARNHIFKFIRIFT